MNIKEHVYNKIFFFLPWGTINVSGKPLIIRIGALVTLTSQFVVSPVWRSLHAYFPVSFNSALLTIKKNEFYF